MKDDLWIYFANISAQKKDENKESIAKRIKRGYNQSEEGIFENEENTIRVFSKILTIRINKIWKLIVQPHSMQ